MGPQSMGTSYDHEPRLIELYKGYTPPLGGACHTAYSQAVRE